MFIDYKHMIQWCGNIFLYWIYWFCVMNLILHFKGKSVFDYTRLFYPRNYENNYKIILKFSQ